MDMIEYNHLIKDDGYILILDFKKAFDDTLEHKFLFKVLENFGFGKPFVNIIKMIYKGMNSSISLPYGTTQRFPISRRIRQGCPLSPLLFIMAADMLSTLVIHDQTVQKLKSNSCGYFISSYFF